jgi:hypothetical protein
MTIVRLRKAICVCSGKSFAGMAARWPGRVPVIAAGSAERLAAASEPDNATMGVYTRRWRRPRNRGPRDSGPRPVGYGPSAGAGSSHPPGAASSAAAWGGPQVPGAYSWTGVASPST